MTKSVGKAASIWKRVGADMLPFADVASEKVPLDRFLRLSMFQMSVGMAVVLLTGTLNRVMIVELGVPAWLVAVMVALPLFFAPLRALIGFRSDIYESVLGWKRVPFIWMGTLLQFGGLAIMPFALLILSGDTQGPVWYGTAAAALAFLLVGAGLHTTQTAGIALATDLAEESARPRVVALLFVMLLVGMFLSSLVFGLLLKDFSQLRLIELIQGAAVVTMVLNLWALWKQEPRVHRGRKKTSPEEKPRFMEQWRKLQQDKAARRLLLAVGLGTAGFAMQDILLEPFGAEVLGLSVGGTTFLTALLAGGMLLAFIVAARRLGLGVSPHRTAGYGVLVGVCGFAIVSLVSMVQSTGLFALGVALIGFGNGFFAVGTLTASMALARKGNHGFVIGAWGAVQATAAGLAVAVGGGLRDVFASLASSGALGEAMSGAAAGYTFVYQIEILMLFATLVVIGPLATFVRQTNQLGTGKIGLADLPN